MTDLAELPGGVLAAATEHGGVRLVRGGAPGAVVVPPRRGAATWFSGEVALTVRGETLTVRSLPDADVVATIPVPAGTRFAAAAPQARRFVVAGRRGASVIGLDGQVLNQFDGSFGRWLGGLVESGQDNVPDKCIVGGAVGEEDRVGGIRQLKHAREVIRLSAPLFFEGVGFMRQRGQIFDFVQRFNLSGYVVHRRLVSASVTRLGRRRRG